MKKNYLEKINLKKKIAVITGANGYLGKMISKTYAELESDLILIDKNNLNATSIRKKYKKNYNINAYYKQCDLNDALDRKKVIAWIKKNFDRVDILVNNAAMVVSSNQNDYSVKFEKQSLTSWNDALNINLTAIFDLVKNLSRNLKKSNNARIINVSSIYGLRSPKLILYEKTKINTPAAYSVSKNALIHLTKWLASNLGPKVRVNSISPGGIYRKQSSKFIKKYQSLTPMQRMAKENDFKGAVIFLSTQMSDYVTGHNLIVDGGWSI